MEILKWQVLNNGRLEKLTLGGQLEYFKLTCERVKWLDELLQCCDPDLWNGHLSAGERDLSLLSAT